MKKCLYCNAEFTEIQKRKVFCSSKCRGYASRNKNKTLTEDWKYIVDKNDAKFALDKSLVLKLAIFFGLDVRVPKKDKIAKNEPKIDIEIKPKVSDVKKPKTIVPPITKPIIDTPISAPFETPQKIKVDYQKEYQSCEFPDEFKALWDKINDDEDVSVAEKRLWKINLNIK